MELYGRTMNETHSRIPYPARGTTDREERRGAGPLHRSRNISYSNAAPESFEPTPTEFFVFKHSLLLTVAPSDRPKRPDCLKIVYDHRFHLRRPFFRRLRPRDWSPLATEFAIAITNEPANVSRERDCSCEDNLTEFHRLFLETMTDEDSNDHSRFEESWLQLEFFKIRYWTLDEAETRWIKNFVPSKRVSFRQKKISGEVPAKTRFIESKTEILITIRGLMRNDCC